VLIKALSVYLKPILDASINSLILGCSHYPLYSEEISSILLGNNIKIVDPAIPAVERLRMELRDMNRLGGGRGVIEVFTTGDVSDFKEKASIFLDIPLKVRHISLREEEGEIKLWQK
jgi:glutamate racemase